MMSAARTMGSTRRLDGVVPNSSSVAVLPRRDRIVIASCTLLVTALAWAYLIQLNRQMSSPMAADVMMNMGTVIDTPWRAQDLLFTFVMWSVMMVGMMSPSAAPVLLLFAGAQAKHARRGVRMPVLLFGLGYLVVWLAFSALAVLAQWGLHEAALLTPMMAASSPGLAGGILIAAGMYQLTPAKRACLRQCQSPLGFIMSNWRDGDIGALNMGVRHGAYCVGCCWAVMGLLFAVGVMNLAWVGLLTAFILIEKFGGAGVGVARIGGVLIITLGVLLVVVN